MAQDSAVSGVGRARQAAGQAQTNPVGQAETRLVPIQRGRQASVEATERAHRDAKAVELSVDGLGRDADTSNLLQHLGVVDGADGGVVVDESASESVPAWLLVEKGQ